MFVGYRHGDETDNRSDHIILLPFIVCGAEQAVGQVHLCSQVSSAVVTRGWMSREKASQRQIVGRTTGGSSSGQQVKMPVPVCEVQ